MFNMQQVGKNIVELRKKCNMTQTELADKLNISFQAVSNWERGNSMPDISKLPELAEIFGVSVDTLLGEKSKLVDSVINNKITECVENNEVSYKEIEEYLPILKPVQIETIVKSMNLDKTEDINAFLPFLDNATIAILAQQKIEKGESIDPFLPFMAGEDIARLAEKKIEKGDSIHSFLPFLSSEALARFAQQMMDLGQSIDSFLPFLDREALVRFAQQKMDLGQSIDSFLPFLDREALARFAHRKIERGESIQTLLPFLDSNVLKDIVLSIAK